MSYVSSQEPREGCIFCLKPCEQKDQENLILCRGVYNYIILNAFPYNTGHLMVVPYAHISELSDLPQAAATEMMQLAQLSICALKKVFRAEAANIGMNLGRAAGAGIDEHMHMHVVPRWSGDANFMLPVAETRVVPQSLEDTWKALDPVVDELYALHQSANDASGGQEDS